MSYLTDEFFGAARALEFLAMLKCAMRDAVARPRCRIPTTIWKAYRSYYRHEERVAPATTSPLRLLRQPIKHAYVGAYLGSRNRNLTMRERALGVLAWLDPGRRAETDFPLKYLPLEKRGRRLDVGCGRGALLATMQSFGWRAEGIDLDPIVVAAARSKVSEVRAGALLG